MEPSLFHRAFHSLQNPRFSVRPHQKTNHKEDNPAKKAFDAEIRGWLSKLQIPPSLPEKSGFLTLPWLSEALKLVRFACTEISNLLPKFSCTVKEKSLLEANLDDTLKLLDVCNGLNEALDDMQHYVMLVHYAMRSVMDLKNTSMEEFKSNVARLHTALTKAAEFMHAKVEENSRQKLGRSKLETCSSMLRRMDDPSVDASGKQEAPNVMFNDLYGAKVLAIFVCSVLAITLSVNPKRPLSCLQMADQPSWLVSLQSLQENVKSITDHSITGGQVALLKELDEVLSHSNILLELSKSLQHEASPTGEERMNLGQECEKLLEKSDRLRKGLYELQQQVDGIFRMLVSIRVDFLDALCHV